MKKLFVIKIGGNIIDDEKALDAFLKNFSAIKEQKILIHGGGKMATTIGNQLGITANYLNGRRITDDATIDLVTMVYGGLINKKIVAKLQAYGCNAMGLTGADGNMIPATKRAIKEIDYGWAGDVNPQQLSTTIWQLLLQNNLSPVVASLTHDGGGQILNTNADTIAATVAIALSAHYQVRLVYCFEKKGVLEDVTNEQSVIPLITPTKYQQLLQEKKLVDGILPKIDNAFLAIQQGVTEVLIGHAHHLLQNTTDNTIGTLIR
jgi:acetylglutamate kinase